MSIREKRSSTISERIFNLNDLERIAKALESKGDENKGATLAFSATCSDSSQFDSASSTLFGPSSSLQNKRVDQISMSLTWTDYGTYCTRVLSGEHFGRIQIELSSAHFYWSPIWNALRNKITIEGHDSTWVNGSLRELEELIGGCKRQISVIRDYRYLIIAILSIGLGRLLVPILIKSGIIAPKTSLDPTPPWVLWAMSTPLSATIFIHAIYLCIGLLGGLFLHLKLNALWPPIELQTGPQHFYPERIWRAVLVVILTSLLLSAFYDLIKFIFFVVTQSAVSAPPFS